MVKLATGQQMAQFFDRRGGPPIQPLSRAQLLDGGTGADLSALGPGRRDALVRNTPLWFYVLREAEHNGGKLTGVGARIVATTFRRAIRNSRRSIMDDPAWRPTLGRNAGKFDMTDLILIAYDHDVRQLAPLEPLRRR
jgi:hypothetical protein